jgi:hypothetical protein
MTKLMRSEDNELLLREFGTLASFVDTNRLHKLASADSTSRRWLSQFKPDNDHFLIHVIGIGDYERYGFNRNADAFTKKANQDYHHTFVDNGHFFREHRNTNPDLRIGEIAGSMHNDAMGRIELALFGHKKKAAAEYEKLQNGENLSFSMSCLVDYDVDNCTGKHCKTAADYEDHMKFQPGQYIPGFRKYAFVFNPHPKHFDMSSVGRPADRIAHYLDFCLNNDGDEMKKAASTTGVMTGAMLAEAEGIVVPQELQHRPLSSNQQILMSKLAGLEADYIRAMNNEGSRDLVTFAKEAAQFAFDPEEDLTDAQIARLRELQPATLFAELGKRATALPFYSFISYAEGRPIAEVRKDPIIKKAAAMLPVMFNNLHHNMAGTDMFDAHDHAFMGLLDKGNSDEIQRLLDEIADKHSAAAGPAAKRTISIRISMMDKPKDSRPHVPVEEFKKALEADESKEEKANEKKANDMDVKAERYVELYGQYKLAAVQAMQSLYRDYSLDNQALIRLISQNHL